MLTTFIRMYVILVIIIIAIVSTTSIYYAFSVYLCVYVCQFILLLLIVCISIKEWQSKSLYLIMVLMLMKSMFMGCVIFMKGWLKPQFRKVKGKEAVETQFQLWI